MALNLEQSSQPEGATQDQLYLMSLRPLLSHEPQKSQGQTWAICSIRQLNKLEGSQDGAVSLEDGNR